MKKDKFIQCTGIGCPINGCCERYQRIVTNDSVFFDLPPRIGNQCKEFVDMPLKASIKRVSLEEYQSKNIDMSKDKVKTVSPYKADETFFWYASRLMEKFEVVYETNSNYAVKDGSFTRFINKDDAFEIISSDEFKQKVDSWVKEENLKDAIQHRDLGFNTLLRPEIKSHFTNSEPIDNTKGENFCDMVHKASMDQFIRQHPCCEVRLGDKYGVVYGNKFEPDQEDLCKTFDTSSPTMDNYILPVGLNSMRDRLEYIKAVHGIPDGGVFDAFFRDAIVNAYRVSKVESTMHPKKMISANEYFNEEYGKD